MKLPWFFIPGGTGSRRWPVLRQQPELVLAGRHADRRRRLAPVGQQGIERAGFDHRAGQDVRADGRGLLDHADDDLRIELLEPDRERQAGGAGAHGDDVVFHHVAFEASAHRSSGAPG